MSYISINQGILTITLETSFNLGAATTTEILYRKPDGTTGSWTATPSGTDMVYNPTNDDIDIAGNWRLQAYCVIGGLDGYGAEVTQQFKLPLNIS